MPGKARALWAKADVKASLALADVRGRFLYEARPDLFPEGYLTLTELELWALHYQRRDAQIKQLASSPRSRRQRK